MTRNYETYAHRRNKSKMFSPVSCFLSHFKFLPLGDASVCIEKMAAPVQKSFCVLEYHTSKSVVTVQRAFRAWCKQFTETGCLCKHKSSGRPLTAEDDDGQVRASFLHNLKK
jgi:hypothetical protein